MHRSIDVLPGTDSLQLDSMLVLPSSIQLEPTQVFRFDQRSGVIHFTPPPQDTLLLSYRVLAWKRELVFAAKDTSMIRNSASDNDFQPYVFRGDLFPDTRFDQGELVKAGSLSRGVSFGNSQDLAVNSNLNLQLSGRITERFQVLASITDDNIPIQPDGNTQQLQDFDRVYIQLFDDQTTITAGDFQITERTHHFLRYQKRARGVTTTSVSGDSLNQFSLGASAAISKGKFARNLIQGVEGNQGPYRLNGAENERFIIIMAGTERVYIDGRLLERGQSLDYTIDYNTAEITFTPRNLITKDRRIVVEFQYSDRNYARALLQGEASGKQRKFEWFLHALSEQDSKNQPLQQDLDADDRRLLSQVGDDVQLAFNSAIDSVGYSDTQVLYAIRDTLGYDSVLVYSNNASQALYRAVFSFVGPGNGDYVEDGFVANGRVYRWVAPDTVEGNIIRQGDHAPLRQLVPPKKRQMLTGGGKISLGKGQQLVLEAAVSSRDENTFSNRDASDNTGFSSWTDYRIERSIQRKTNGAWKWGGRVFHEYVSEHFNEIERFRSVEFDRDWNIRGLNLRSDQHVGGVSLNLLKNNVVKWELEGSGFVSGSAYEGYRTTSSIHYQEKRRVLDWDGSYTLSQGLRNTRFLRQKTNIALPVGLFRVGYQDDFEWNRFNMNDTLSAMSYRFYEWKTWLGSREEQKFTWKAFYSQRDDRLPLNNELALAAEAESYGVEGQYTSAARRQLRWNVARRTLSITDSSLTSQRPEETLVGRLEASGGFFKGLVNGQLFYETGSGLEQARQFVYIEVPPGQGNYVWIDYNGDGVKDLNEFEVANFQYEANYLRAFVPSDTYVRTYSNAFTTNVQIQPARVWTNAKGAKKFLSRFGENASLRLDRKTGIDRGWRRLDPFARDVADSSVITLGSSFRNTLSFNRTDPGFGVEYTYQNLSNQALLANGFESRKDEYHELRLRKRVANDVTFIGMTKRGVKATSSDFLTGRNYLIHYLSLEPEFQWQPSNTFRLTMKGRRVEKEDRQEGGDTGALIHDLGISLRFSDPGKGLIEAGATLLDIRYNGETNNALAFEMLESLVPGKNATWNISVQRSLSRTLQLNILYNGRTSEDGPMIHVGSVQVRAAF